jgi:hypothetical protein
LPLTLANDRRGHPPGESLFAVLAQDALEIG